MADKANDAIITLDKFFSNLNIPKDDKEKAIQAFDVITQELESWKKAYHSLDPVGYILNKPLKDR